MTLGRPLKFQSVEELQEKIDAYFDNTPPEEVTITGLAISLDTSRETLMNYEKRDGYFDTIKKAKDKVQLEYEKDLRKKGRSGDIFALKNFGWTDERTQKHSGGITFEIIEGDEEEDKPLESTLEPEEGNS